MTTGQQPGGGFAEYQPRANRPQPGIQDQPAVEQSPGVERPLGVEQTLGVERLSVEVRVRVRAGVRADLEACAGLIVSRAGGSAADRRTRLVADLEDPERYIAVAEVDGEVVGYGGVIRHDLSPDDPPATAPSGYYLIGLIVAPNWRRHGIGDELTKDRMRWIAERADAAYTFVNVGNGAILDLHQRFRFTELTRDFTFPGAPLQPGTCVLLRADLTDQ
ncbi:GNAT family N-acetyltransferase [Kribbella solani]|uniref:GNAT family N-acetyltransferase n=1 Tax=Kribbella solani TaxID=236067 RepID=UPI0029BF5B14|nr:GNAT family N-acetyltransferase [Kribbella solani]MDX2970815.1 GNAT family N-acetyltransferase [Kribbella solani]MDX3006787.1 GNAT family N-acetyltransferase [Kribbella solani]